MKKTKLLIIDDIVGQKRVEKYNKKWNSAQKQKKLIMKNQINKIQAKEKRRAESIQKYQMAEKANAIKLRRDHKKLIEK